MNKITDLESQDLFSKQGIPVFQGESIAEIFPDMIYRVMNEGAWVQARGMGTWELLHAVTRLENPRRRILAVPGRRTNPFFNLAEFVWILAGSSNAKWISFFNSQLKSLVDPYTPFDNHASFHGAYGERLRRSGFLGEMSRGRPHLSTLDQLLDNYTLLRDEEGTRRAVALIWNPEFDNPSVRTPDLPCNIALMFKKRAGKLHLSVMNRSNDVILGLTATNVVQFTILQEVMASALGIDLGPYVHYSDSLHVYEIDPFSGKPTADMLERIRCHDNAGFDLYKHVDPVPMNIKRHFGRFVDFFSWVETLYDYQAGTIGARTIHDGRSSCLRSEDPFWFGVQKALECYTKLKLGGALDAVSAWGQMPISDWKIECARDLVFRLRNKAAQNTHTRDSFIRVVESIGTILKNDENDCNYPELLKYIYD